VDGKALRRLEMLRGSIRGHQRAAAQHEPGVNDLVLPLRRHARCSRGLAVREHGLDLAAEDLRVELEGLTACALEEYVGIQLHRMLPGSAPASLVPKDAAAGLLPKGTRKFLQGL